MKRLALLLLVALPLLAGAETLREQCYRLSITHDYGGLLAPATRLYEQGRHEGDATAQGYGAFYRGVSLMLAARDTTAGRWLEEALRLAQEAGNDSLEGLALNSLGLRHDMLGHDYYLAQTSFLSALAAARRANHRSLMTAIHGNLAQLSLMQNDTTGLEHARASYELARELGNEHSLSFSTFCLATQLMWRGETEQALQWALQSLQHYRRLGSHGEAPVWSLLATLYNDLGRRDEAHAAVDSVLATPERTIYAVNAHLQQARLDVARGHLAAADRHARRALHLADSLSLHHYDIALLELLASNAEARGDLHTAIALLQERNRVTDRQAADNAALMRRERAMVMEIADRDRALALHDAALKRRNVTILLLGALLAVAAIALWVIVKQWRRREELYRSIVRQNRDAIRREDTLTEKSSPRIIDDTKARDIYLRLCHAMEHDRLYADPQLNRERLAESLGTNRTYLSQIVKGGSGMSLPQFVNSYRVKAAIRMLDDRLAADAALSSLGTELGFTSQATFIRAFKQQVGMTPSEYRRAALQVADN